VIDDLFDGIVNDLVNDLVNGIIDDKQVVVLLRGHALLRLIF